MRRIISFVTIKCQSNTPKQIRFNRTMNTQCFMWWSFEYYFAPLARSWQINSKIHHEFIYSNWIAIRLVLFHRFKFTHKIRELVNCWYCYTNKSYIFFFLFFFEISNRKPTRKYTETWSQTQTLTPKYNYAIESRLANCCLFSCCFWIILINQ